MDQALKFATRMLGLEVPTATRRRYLRSDDAITLGYLDAPGRPATVGFELRTQEDLDARPPNSRRRDLR